MKEKLRGYLDIFFAVFLFLLLSYLVSSNVDYLRSKISIGYFGMILYFFIVVAAIVLAPVSMVPLIPVASNLWGFEVSAVLNILGWTVGAVIAFLVARFYGRELVLKIVPMGSLKRIEKKIPSENLFWSVVFLRMAVPVDVLSYAIGLFTSMDLARYTLATFIGVIPFGIILSYAGAAPFYYQITAVLIGLLILFLGYKRFKAGVKKIK